MSGANYYMPRPIFSINALLQINNEILDYENNFVYYDMQPFEIDPKAFNNGTLSIEYNESLSSIHTTLLSYGYCDKLGSQTYTTNISLKPIEGVNYSADDIIVNINLTPQYTTLENTNISGSISENINTNIEYILNTEIYVNDIIDSEITYKNQSFELSDINGLPDGLNTVIFYDNSRRTTFLSS